MHRTIKKILAGVLALTMSYACGDATAPRPFPEIEGSISYDPDTEAAKLVVTAANAESIECKGDLSGTATGPHPSLSTEGSFPITEEQGRIVSECTAVAGAADTARVLYSATVPANLPPVISNLAADSARYYEQSRGQLYWQASGGGPGIEEVSCVASTLARQLEVERSGSGWIARFVALEENQRVDVTCSDSRGLKNSQTDTTTTLQISPRFIDQGDITVIPELGIELFDVMAFTDLTQQEVYDSVAAMGDGWRFASSAEVRPIFSLLDEEGYLTRVRHIIGSYEVSAEGKRYYNTGGRVADSSDNHFTWLWGFGNGIQLYNREEERVEYIWSTFGIGADYAEVRFAQMGAWVIRNR